MLSEELGLQKLLKKVERDAPALVVLGSSFHQRGTINLRVVHVLSELPRCMLMPGANRAYASAPVHAFFLMLLTAEGAVLKLYKQRTFCHHLLTLLHQLTDVMSSVILRHCITTTNHIWSDNFK